MNILIVSTSHPRLGSSAIATGLGLETLAGPYYRFLDAGATVAIASPLGGKPPVDPLSISDETSTDETRRFDSDAPARASFENSLRLGAVSPDAYDAVFFAGGHGGMWDFAGNPDVSQLIGRYLWQNKPVAAICHGPAALCGVLDDTGRPVVAGRRVTGLSNAEERVLGRDRAVPFLLEDRLRSLGGDYASGPNFKSFVVADGPLITGQNMRSARAAAETLLDLLR